MRLYPKPAACELSQLLKTLSTTPASNPPPNPFPQHGEGLSDPTSPGTGQAMLGGYRGGEPRAREAPGAAPQPAAAAPARRGRGEAARYSWKPGGEVMLPECCCNLRPGAQGR